MARKKKAKAKGRVISVDFSQVGGKLAKVPEGDYIVEVDSIEQDEGETSGKPYLKWMLKITEGKFAGKMLMHRTSLQPQALFNLRDTLEALGQDVPESAADLNLDDFTGLTMGVGVEHEIYNGRRQSRVVDVFSEDELEDEEEEEEEEEVEEEEDEEEEEEEEEMDYEEMSLKELKAEAKERGLKVKKGMDKDDIIEMLEGDDE